MNTLQNTYFAGSNEKEVSPNSQVSNNLPAGQVLLEKSTKEEENRLNTKESHKNQSLNNCKSSILTFAHMYPHIKQLIEKGVYIGKTDGQGSFYSPDEYLLKTQELGYAILDQFRNNKIEELMQFLDEQQLELYFTEGAVLSDIDKSTKKSLLNKTTEYGTKCIIIKVK